MSWSACTVTSALPHLNSPVVAWRSVPALSSLTNEDACDVYQPHNRGNDAVCDLAAPGVAS